MFSHNHSEQYNIVRDMNFGEPVLMNFIVGSGTSFSGKSPSFNLVYLDPETMLPVDYECYSMNITEAN